MWRYQSKDIFLERLRHDSDLSVSIRDAFTKNGAGMGFFMAIGAVRSATVGFYDQVEKAYKNIVIDRPAEILSCTGNISKVEDDALSTGTSRLGLRTVPCRRTPPRRDPHFGCELFGIMILDGEQLSRVF
jgi:hypothetical protein